MNALDQIAPYPRTVEAVTAQAMARHYTAYVQMHYQRALSLLRLPAQRQEYRASLSQVTWGYGVVYLLRELEERAGIRQADEVARFLWQEWEDGDGLGHDVWAWMAEYGIDPEAVDKVADQGIAGTAPRREVASHA